MRQLTLSSDDAIFDRLSIEKKIWKAGIHTVCGLDEVGRGCLAGPVMACAIIFERDFIHSEVRDSKLLSARKREELKKILCENAVTWAVGQASNHEIDHFNIRQATFLAMRRALDGLAVPPDYLLVDGESLPSAPCISAGIVKGDRKSFTIAAASIIAKQTRDLYMINLAEKVPGYFFDRNKGYGTREHVQAIETYGLSEYHRRTFTEKYNYQDLQNNQTGL